MSKVKIDLSRIDVSGLETDEDFRKVATAVIPKALEQIGEGAAEAAWDGMQEALKGSPFKMNRSLSDKHKYIQEGGRKKARDASQSEKRELEERIVKQLREIKAKSGGSFHA